MTAFRMSGAALVALADVAASMEATEFSMVAQGDTLRLTVAHVPPIAVAEATLSIVDGPKEAVTLCCDLKRFRADIKGFEKAPEVEVSKEGAHMVLKAGRRRCKSALIDGRYVESQKFPPASDTHAMAPIAFLRQCAAATRAGAADISYGDGLLKWASEHEVGGFEDAIECDTQGAAASCFSPGMVEKVLGPASGSAWCTISLHPKGPAIFEFELAGGKGRAALMHLEDVE